MEVIGMGLLVGTAGGLAYAASNYLTARLLAPLRRRWGLPE